MKIDIGTDKSFVLLPLYSTKFRWIFTAFRYYKPSIFDLKSELFANLISIMLAIIISLPTEKWIEKIQTEG